MLDVSHVVTRLTDIGAFSKDHEDLYVAKLNAGATYVHDNGTSVSLKGMYYVYGYVDPKGGADASRLGLVYHDAKLSRPFANGEAIAITSLDYVDDVFGLDYWAKREYARVTVEAEPVDDEQFEPDASDDAASKPFWRPMIGERVRIIEDESQRTLATVYTYGRVYSWDRDNYSVTVTNTNGYRHEIGDRPMVSLNDLEPAPLPMLDDSTTMEIIRDYILRQYKAYSSEDCEKHLRLVIEAGGHPNTRDDINIECRAEIDYGNAVKAPELHDAMDVAIQRYKEDSARSMKRLPRY